MYRSSRAIVMATKGFEVRRLSGLIGAEILGVNLGTETGDSVITPVIKLEHETKNFGGIWHTDTAYLEIPPMGAMLLARKVPSHGGDTLFANTYLAYETLAEGKKRMLDGLTAINHSGKADVTRTREDRMRDGGKPEANKEYTSEHPVVRTHLETGCKALYVNYGHTLRFKDMT
jgi:taurine dioxygenase